MAISEERAASERECAALRTDNERLKRALDLNERDYCQLQDHADMLFVEGQEFKRERDAAREALSDAADHLAGATGLTPGDQIKIDEALAAMGGETDGK